MEASQPVIRRTVYKMGMFKENSYVPSFRVRADEKLACNAFDAEARRVIGNDENFKANFLKLEKMAIKVFTDYTKAVSIQFFRTPEHLLSGVTKRVMDKWIAEEKKTLIAMETPNTETNSNVYPIILCWMTLRNFVDVENLFVLIKADMKKLGDEYLSDKQIQRRVQKNYKGRQLRKAKKWNNSLVKRS